MSTHSSRRLWILGGLVVALVLVVAVATNVLRRPTPEKRRAWILSLERADVTAGSDDAETMFFTDGSNWKCSKSSLGDFIDHHADRMTDLGFKTARCVGLFGDHYSAPWF